MQHDLIGASYRSRNQIWLKSKACFGNSFACRFASVSVVITLKHAKAQWKACLL
jgi:hypothetical protein